VYTTTLIRRAGEKLGDSMITFLVILGVLVDQNIFCNDVIAGGSELLAMAGEGGQLLDNQQDVITLLTAIRISD
jgi:hypothetical protein